MTSELTYPCPACTKARELMRELVTEVRGDRDLKLIDMASEGTPGVVSLEPLLHCRRCGDTGSVLTDAGLAFLQACRPHLQTATPEEPPY